jgi:hypothetical protein
MLNERRMGDVGRQTDKSRQTMMMHAVKDAMEQLVCLFVCLLGVRKVGFPIGYLVWY